MDSLISLPLVDETDMPTTAVPSSSTVQDYQNNSVKLVEKKSLTEKASVRWPVKNKLNKKAKKMRLNARLHRLICPKSPLMVFSELFHNVPIQIVKYPMNNGIRYVAIFEVDDQLYTGSHVSKTQAKELACENFLRPMFMKKIEEQYVPTSNGPPQDDFPWVLFGSLAMHNLISQCVFKTVSKDISSQEEPKFIPKAGVMSKFPDDLSKWNPVNLMYLMMPSVHFTVTTLSKNFRPHFRTICVIDNITFIGQGSNKKTAKKECCIAVIKYFWKFDYHAEGNKFITKNI